jgi:hypothetical protein
MTNILTNRDVFAAIAFAVVAHVAAMSLALTYAA